METQLKFVTKEEAHKLIDDIPGNGVMILTYKDDIGISDCGKYTKKKKGKRFVDKANILVLKSNSPIMTLNLHDKIFTDFSNYDREHIVRTILLTQRE